MVAGWDGAKVFGETIASADYNERTLRIKESLGAADSVTFADGDATPSVTGTTLFKTANTAPTTITNFANPTEKPILIIVGDALTSIANNANIRLQGNFGPLGPLPLYSTLLLVYNGVIWCEISRSLNG